MRSRMYMSELRGKHDLCIIINPGHHKSGDLGRCMISKIEVVCGCTFELATIYRLSNYKGQVLLEFQGGR